MIFYSLQYTFMNIMLFKTIDTTNSTRINKGLRNLKEGGMIYWDESAPPRER